jgi:hypothetical protein
MGNRVGKINSLRFIAMRVTRGYRIGVLDIVYIQAYLIGREVIISYSNRPYKR